MTDRDIVAAMQKFGGSFIMALAHAYLVADDQNRARIKAAFPEAWAEYAELVELHAKRQAESC